MFDPNARTRFDHVLDALASRHATVIAVLLVLLIGVSSFAFVREGQARAMATQQMFMGPTVRESAVSISEIYRFRRALEQLVDAGADQDAALAEVGDALDMLFVRHHSIAGSRADVPFRADSARAERALRQLIAAADEAFQAGADGIIANAARLDEMATEASSNLVQYMNALHADQRRALAANVATMEQLTNSQLTFLIGMVTFAIVLQSLLRREVLNRRGRADAEREVAFLAYFDRLTGLPNRLQSTNAMTEFFRPVVAKPPHGRALAFIDLDGFKEINAFHGHHVGDTVLKEVAHRLRRVCEPMRATVSRVAGDEFAVLLPRGDLETLRAFCQKVMTVVQRPVTAMGVQLVPTVSIGLAGTNVVSSIMPIGPEAMSRTADFALDRAKEQRGRSQFCIFDADLARQFAQRRARLSALEMAIETEAIDVWLQPQIDLKTLELSGFEALARWCHEGTMVRPDEFIALAEENGLIVDLDLVVLRKATQIIAAWNRRYGRECPVSVNLSALHASSPQLISSVRDALDAAGLEAHLLTLELTETVEVDDWKEVSALLSAITALGCGLSIDDFGSGYSSLGYLRNMPADELKIDRSLVDGIETSQEGRSIVSSVVDIAHALAFTTVVEGIETAAQAQIARELGCTHAQGYYFSRPLPAANLPPPDEVFSQELLSAVGVNGLAATG